jgi:hypothetical protein
MTPIALPGQCRVANCAVVSTAALDRAVTLTGSLDATGSHMLIQIKLPLDCRQDDGHAI